MFCLTFISEYVYSFAQQCLILDWAPQKLILKHPSMGVFVSHCGWNSTLESLAVGVPVVAWPMFADQKLNAEWLVQRGTAVMIEGTGLKPERVIPREEIAAVVRSVGWNVNGSGDTPLRQVALRWKVKLAEVTGPGGSAELALQKIINF